MKTAKARAIRYVLNKLVLKLLLATVAMLIFTGCGGGSSGGAENGNTADEDQAVVKILQGSFEDISERYARHEQFKGIESLEWNTTAWKGERVHKQLLLWSELDLNNVSYRVTALANHVEEIPSSRVGLLSAKYVKADSSARSCEGYPNRLTFVEISDALSEDLPEFIESGDPLKTWVYIDVPSDISDGSYRGAIEVDIDGVTEATFNIQLEVINRTLPNKSESRFHLDLWQFPVSVWDRYNDTNSENLIEIWSDEHFKLLESSYLLLAGMGQKSITTYIKDGALGASSMVEWTLKSDGVTWEYDFSVFDRYVNQLMQWGITEQISAFSPIGWNKDVIPYYDESSGARSELNAAVGSEIHRERWDHFLTVFKTHLDARGWFDKTVLFMDENTEAEVEVILDLVEANHSDWKTGLAYGHDISSELRARLDDSSGILGVAEGNSQGETSQTATFYTSCTQTQPNSYVTMDNSPAEMTWMAWYAAAQGFDGYLRWAYDNWRLNDPFDLRDNASTTGDFSIIYRDSNRRDLQAMPSMRSLMLRDGIEDYEKIHQLRTALVNCNDTSNLNLLDSMIAEFVIDSAANAPLLVKGAQEFINDIAGVACN